ncbi:ribonuclease T [Legionella oakridgensis]|uniref:Ribonuclease T n=1 Tax=Legionella oakridgensis TaxID=29423 RepID=A0A0W0X0Z8_9GAMM|nr:ribonuclease T [Legionella oakridgensis]ETO94507.1 RNAse T [Legionella oakridgensis RV-2-2007]KTD38229.1 ribonuclease T [Legionella oakridgensis]STY15641.1 ribonuclease T [Legionella longbeachae]
MKPHNSMIRKQIKDRFRGFLPVVVDVETAGIDPKKNALLEMCVVLLDIDNQGRLSQANTFFEHILPFDGAELDVESLAFTGIDPYQPLRFAVDEATALQRLFHPIYKALNQHHCQRAVLVGHNAWFDLLFIKEAVKRTNLKSPFHAFTCFDTATLAGLVYGQTVLAKAVKSAGIPFDVNEAHSAIYDAQKTAELFCAIVNSWDEINASTKMQPN